METHRIYALPAGYLDTMGYQTSGSHSGGTVGPLFVVLAIIVILGVVAGLVGRVCSGRHWGGDTEHDFEGWVERRCASCIDGDVEAGGGDKKPAENGTVPPPPPPPPAEAGAADAKPAEDVKPAEGATEAKPAEGGDGGGGGEAGGGGEGPPAAEEAKAAEGDAGRG